MDPKSQVPSASGRRSAPNDPVNVTVFVKYVARSVNENNLVVPASVPSNFSVPAILESVEYVLILAILFVYFFFILARRFF